jgi:hypothetical protein
MRPREGEAMTQTQAGTSLAITALALMGGVGCASVPMAPAQVSAQMKRWPAPPDAAVVYLYRNESFGAAVSMDVTLDGRPYGQTVAKTFMVWEIAPGAHQLVSKAENDDTLTIDVRPGRRYFVWQEVKMGVLIARSRLHPVSDAQGQAGVDECELIRMPLPRRPTPSAPPAAPIVPPGPPAS